MWHYCSVGRTAPAAATRAVACPAVPNPPTRTCCSSSVASQILAAWLPKAFYGIVREDLQATCSLPGSAPTPPSPTPSGTRLCGSPATSPASSSSPGTQRSPPAREGWDWWGVGDMGDGEGPLYFGSVSSTSRVYFGTRPASVRKRLASSARRPPVPPVPWGGPVPQVGDAWEGVRQAEGRHRPALPL